jgi:hypothetical protein
MNSVYFVPSFYAHILNALFVIIAFIILFKNYSKVSNLEPYKLIVIALLFSLSVGVHGLSHLGLEKGYGYNPMYSIIA